MTKEELDGHVTNLHKKFVRKHTMAQHHEKVSSDALP